MVGDATVSLIKKGENCEKLVAQVQTRVVRRF